MEISDSILTSLAEETNISKSHVYIYYDILTRIPCVYNGQKYQLLNCLYLLINLRKATPCDFDSDDFNYILSDALFKTYKEISIPYLSLYYIGVNGIQMIETVKSLKKEKSQ